MPDSKRETPNPNVVVLGRRDVVKLGAGVFAGVLAAKTTSAQEEGGKAAKAGGPAEAKTTPLPWTQAGWVNDANRASGNAADGRYFTPDRGVRQLRIRVAIQRFHLALAESHDAGHHGGNDQRLRIGACTHLRPAGADDSEQPEMHGHGLRGNDLG